MLQTTAKGRRRPRGRKASKTGKINDSNDNEKRAKRSKATKAGKGGKSAKTKSKLRASKPSKKEPETDLQTSVRAMEKLGYVVKYFLLETGQWCYLAARRRYWFIGVRRSDLLEANISEEKFGAIAEELVALSKEGHPVQTWDDVLLPETDPLIVEYLRHLVEHNENMAPAVAAPSPTVGEDSLEAQLESIMEEGGIDGAEEDLPATLIDTIPELTHSDNEGGADGDADADSPAEGAKKIPKWMKIHKRMFADAKLPWPAPPPSPELCAVFPGVLALPQREWEIVVFFNFQELNRTATKTLDVSQCLSMSSVPVAASCHCITPTAKLWLARRMRCLHPEEHLRLMGIWFDGQALEQWNRTPKSLKACLAGNVFCVAYTSAIFFTLSVLLALVEHCRDTGASFPASLSDLSQPSPAPRTMMPTKGGCSDSDDSD